MAAVAPLVVRYVPVTQATHVAAITAPTASEYVPAAHSTQLVAPAGMYVPARHGAHATAFAGECFPAPHCKHDAARDAGEYVPGVHETHALAVNVPDERFPAAQCTQPYLAPVFECEPDGHCVQPLCPTVEYVPSPQSTHSVYPVSSLYLPAAHAEQPFQTSPV